MLLSSFFPLLVGPTQFKLAVIDCSSISVLMLLSSVFSVIGRAHSGSTGGCPLRQNFSVDVTVESIFRHRSGSTGSFCLLQNFSVAVTVESIFRHWSDPLWFKSAVVVCSLFQC